MQTSKDLKSDLFHMIHNWKIKKYDWAAVCIIIIFFFSGTLTLKYYSLTWDEGLGNVFFGVRNLFFFTHFEDRYLDFNARLAIDEKVLNLAASPLRNYPEQFPPFTDTLSAASMYLFSYTLGWMDPVDGFHFLKIILATIFLWILYRFVQQEWGSLIGIFSILFLSFFPRFWGDMHFNPKDIPETIWIGLVIITYYYWIKNRTILRAILLGVLFGAAMATKANALFVPLILVLGLWELKLPAGTLSASIKIWIRDLSHYAIMGVAALIVFVGSWPSLYVHGSLVSGIQTYYTSMFRMGLGSGYEHWNSSGLSLSLFSIPLWMLLWLWLGITFCMQMVIRKRDPKWRLLLVWLIFPILRITMPRMVNFDGIRHYMEFVPAAAILAGIGVQFFISQIKRIAHQRIAVSVITVGWLVSILWIYGSLFPHLYIYYNPLIGGVAGARQYFGPDEVTDYWGNSLRQGMEWINQNASKGAIVYTPLVGYLVDITAPLWLRDDLKVIHPETLKELQGQERPVLIMLLYRPVFWNEMARIINRNYVPIKVFTVEGQPILQIYELFPD